MVSDGKWMSMVSVIVVNVLSHILRLSRNLCVSDFVVLEVFFVGNSHVVVNVEVSGL